MTYLEQLLSDKAILIIIFIFLVFERIVNTFLPTKVSRSKIIKTYYRVDFYVLLTAYLANVTISIVNFLRLIDVNFKISTVGVAILLIGIIIRRLSIKELGGLWSVFLDIREGHYLVKSGIYSRLRHPYYVAVLMELTGFALVCNSWLSVLLVGITMIPLMAYRVECEEKMLKKHFRVSQLP